MSEMVTVKMVDGVSYACPQLSKESFTVGSTLEVERRIADALLADFYLDKASNEHHYWVEVAASDKAVVQESSIDSDAELDEETAADHTPKKAARTRR